MLSNKTSGYVAFKAPHGGGTATLLLNCSHGAHGLDLISVHFLMFSFQCSAVLGVIIASGKRQSRYPDLFSSPKPLIQSLAKSSSRIQHQINGSMGVK